MPRREGDEDNLAVGVGAMVNPFPEVFTNRGLRSDLPYDVDFDYSISGAQRPGCENAQPVDWRSADLDVVHLTRVEHSNTLPPPPVGGSGLLDNEPVAALL